MFGLYRRNFVYFFLFLFLCSILIFNFTGRRRSSKVKFSSPSKSPCSKSMKTSSSFDVVLSYYAENLDDVDRFIRSLKNLSILQKLQPRFFLYNKNSQIDNEFLRERFQIDFVQSLPNVGREGAVFLHHIIENYYSLANHTIFSQAGVEGMTKTNLEQWFIDRLEQQFNSSVGFMPLVKNDLISVFYCNRHRSNHFFRLSELWAILEQNICPINGYAVTYRGQFLVSDRRIRNRPLRIYKYLYELITADDFHWLHEDLRSIFYRSTSNNPIFGHVIERAWTIIFQCTETNLFDRCQRNECACFDQ